ncbi:hypothetical protein [Mumia sp. Pv 4-285]|uniref:hypothetical protein n=1 Tax=Mumia qirimensis TaxID=3234852 RepID=UPI00351D970B
MRALADALVERWIARGAGPGVDPWLSLWSYDFASARLLGDWSGPARSAHRLDAWARTEVLRRLARTSGPLSAPGGAIGTVLAWGRTGRPEIRSDDLAWFAAVRATATGQDAEHAEHAEQTEHAEHAEQADDVRRESPTVLVVSRGGWVSVPDGIVGRSRSTRASTRAGSRRN